MSSNKSSSNENKSETYNKDSHLFYAYAHRVDRHDYSRYILTFESASLANRWFHLIQAEYGEDQCRRNGPQLFAFQGDDFPGKVARNKKIQEEEGLGTRWFYTQFGNATGTDGREVGILPVQDGNGNCLNGGGGGGKEVADNQSTAAGAGKEMMDELRTLSQKNAEQITALTEALQKTTQQRDDAAQDRPVAKDDTATAQKQQEQQIQSLIEAQTSAQKSSKEAADQTTAQIKALTEMQAKTQEENRALREQNSALLAELKRQRQQQEKQQGQQKPAAACPHDVHPKPRKIDRTVVGYNYEPQGKGGKTLLKA